MILKGAEIGRYLARPDPTRPALLIHGQDAMRVALKRAEAVKALVGPQAEEEMRLTRIPGADLRKDVGYFTDITQKVFDGKIQRFLDFRMISLIISFHLQLKISVAHFLQYGQRFLYRSNHCV